MQRYQLSNHFIYLYCKSRHSLTSGSQPAKRYIHCYIKAFRSTTWAKKTFMIFWFVDQRQIIQNTEAVRVPPSTEQTGSVCLPIHLAIMIFNMKCNTLASACWICLQSKTINTGRISLGNTSPHSVCLRKIANLFKVLPCTRKYTEW